MCGSFLLAAVGGSFARCNLHASNGCMLVTELCVIHSPPAAKFTYCGVRTRMRLNRWQSALPLLGVVVEFGQLASTPLLQRYESANHSLFRLPVCVAALQ